MDKLILGGCEFGSRLFLGTGKSSIANHCLTTALAEDTIVLEYNCFETTILDDILLAFLRLVNPVAYFQIQRTLHPSSQNRTHL